MRGNVKLDKNGKRNPIGRGAADRLEVGTRGQRAGLCYDEGFEGFEPSRWPWVVDATKGARRLRYAVERSLESPPSHGDLERDRDGDGGGDPTCSRPVPGRHPHYRAPIEAHCEEGMPRSGAETPADVQVADHR